MDAQTLQFAMFLGLAAGVYTLVTVGIEIARRLTLQSRDTAQAGAGVVEVIPTRHK
ncbi:hypothetical protein LF41_2898 [Lysobacter dokdonensis DS-58]|uniref:Uncharacterized protein n=1 Tax=Lysobacter dokdonensis DS-58 TaxID=1300345 RepID=A0A0A2WKL2_9GAMM|nr:hypothetical protein [Lysobacter dokdonensis]KGQ19252.1 hypothetical protein LF41_2898 [Lysobacter dokdonensis DS-58]